MKDWLKKWWPQVLLAFGCCLATSAVVYGVLTHQEAGFTPGGSTRWERPDFPLTIFVADQDEKWDDENSEALHSAVGTINFRLGFPAFRVVGTDRPDPKISMQLQVPYEKGKMETSGLATCEKGWCKVQICNVPTVTEMTLAIRHELGHVLGLAHDDFEDSLMYGGELNADQQYRLTDYDRSIIRARYSQ
jgi:hypothetical protein